MQLQCGLHSRAWPVTGFQTSPAGYRFLRLSSWTFRFRQPRLYLSDCTQRAGPGVVDTVLKTTCAETSHLLKLATEILGPQADFQPSAPARCAHSTRPTNCPSLPLEAPPAPTPAQLFSTGYVRSAHPSRPVTSVPSLTHTVSSPGCVSPLSLGTKL